MNQKISVCMATYNGSTFIKSQIESILIQISNDDELVICDDSSTDNTVELIQSYKDSRIKLFINDVNLGHVKNFEKAICLASGTIIALSDQDDIWYPDRLKLMKDKLIHDEQNILVVSNFDAVDCLLTLTPFRGVTQQPMSRIARLIGIFIGKIPYFGCTFLMRKDLVALSTPFPHFVEAHDIWIGLIANTYGKTVHIEESTLKRRIHDNNLTPQKRRPILVALKSRLVLLLIYIFHVTKHR